MSVSGDVLLVGSVPLASVEEVLRTCGRAVGDRVFALPDGEVGERSTWIGALPHMSYVDNPDLEAITLIPREQVVSPDGQHDDLLSGSFSTFRLKPGVTETRFDLHFGPAAISSYEVFQRLREEGTIPEGVRFQVCIPFTSDAIDIFFPEPADHPIVTRAYEDSVRATIDSILEHVPADDLAIQWDYCSEVLHVIGALDRFAPTPPPGTSEERFQRLTSPEYLAPLSKSIPDEVLVGYHLCYGTWGGWPMTEVRDLDLCVRLANALVANTPHRIDFMHLPSMPDPDEEFFAPLARLEVGDARVFLGIECSDGLEALMHRAELARRHLPDFGIAHYCGYGRDDGADISALLADSREAARRLAGESWVPT